MLFLWFYHACRRNSPRFLMVADHINYLTFEDPGAVNTVRRALKLAHAGDLHGAAETAGVDVPHASVVSEALLRGMRFSIGAEVDNDPRARPDAQNIVDAMRPDGLIRSVNFVTIEHPEKGADWAWAFDNDEFAQLHDVVGPDKLWELYVAKLLDDLEKLPAHIVGQFYSPAHLGRWPAQKRLEEYEDRLLTVCHSRGLAVEVNTRFLYRDNTAELKKKYLDANARLVRKAKALGVGIAIGSDAHSPKDQGNAFDVVLKMLDEAKINEIVFPVGGRLARVALRATREHLEAQAKTRETFVPGSSITGFGRAELGLPEQAEVPASARRDRRTKCTVTAGSAPRLTAGGCSPFVRRIGRDQPDRCAVWSPCPRVSDRPARPPCSTGTTSSAHHDRTRPETVSPSSPGTTQTCPGMPRPFCCCRSVVPPAPGPSTNTRRSRHPGPHSEWPAAGRNRWASPPGPGTDRCASSRTCRVGGSPIGMPVVLDSKTTRCP